jgi:hypothetical protein
MAAGSTYSSIATATSGGTSYTFSSIPSTYTDLILVIGGTANGTNINYGLRFNGDSGSNYSVTRLYGNGTSATSDRISNVTNTLTSNMTDGANSVIHHIMNYSNTTTYKTVLARSNTGANLVWANVALWRSTAAINSIEYFTTASGSMASTTLTLYGILAA